MINHSIDVLMPVFNGDRYLVEAIRSILNQTRGDFLLHVLDGGSADATREIVSFFERVDQRVKFHDFSGVHPADRINAFLLRSSAPFVAMMHADDVSHPKRFEAQLRTFLGDAELVMLGAATHYWLHNKENSEDLGYVGVRHYPTGALNIVSRLPFYWCFSLPSIMFRREFVVENRLFFNSSLKFCADYDWYYRVCKIGKADNLSEVLLSYRHHFASDGPQNKNLLDREHGLVRRYLLEQEFRGLGVGDLDFLASISMEPEVSQLNRGEIKQVRRIFEAISITTQDEDLRDARRALFAEYLKQLEFRRFDHLIHRQSKFYISILLRLFRGIFGKV